ncbi:MAG: hypothetical protein IJG38_01980 [Thermoguttaceae bacterium]|nr:hypothetical protein [Thermoguttaceae bacterium]
MLPQTSIPLVQTPEELKRLINFKFTGIANVNLNKETVDYMLSLIGNQRPPVYSAIKAYIDNFIEHGYECIQLMHISESGDFADGQHRLLALQSLFHSDENFPTSWQLVMIGTTNDRVKDLDNGIPRRPKDVLRMAGKCTDTALSSALSAYVKAVFHRTTGKKILSRELEEVWDREFNEIEKIGTFPALKNITLLNQHSYRPPAWVIVCFYLCYRVYGLEKTCGAYEEFYNGTDSTLPMVRFREWLIANRREIARPNLVSSDEITRIFGYFFYAFKNFVNGMKVSRMRTVRLGKQIGGRQF